MPPADALTPAESALLCAVHYGVIVPPSDLPGFAASPHYSPAGPPTEGECRLALASCLAKGWLQVIDRPALRDITTELKDRHVLGPVYGLPPVGGVDFTRLGADLWHSLLTGPEEGHASFAYTDVVHTKAAHYFPTKAAALREAGEIRSGGGVVSLAGPTPTGPWRVQWWRRFPAGYRINVEERWQYRGYCGGGDTWHWDREHRPPGPARLAHILDCHNVALGEWLVLAAADDANGKYPVQLAHCAAHEAREAFGITASVEECQKGLEACLANGWLRAMDARAAAGVHALLRRDRAAAPLYRKNGLALGEVDFTPGGAMLYRMIAAEYHGLDWEAGISVSTECYRKEHRYSETAAGIRAAQRDYEDGGEAVVRSHTRPIGPWAVFWWERFPAGFRLEVEIGEA